MIDKIFAKAMSRQQECRHTSRGPGVTSVTKHNLNKNYAGHKRTSVRVTSETVIFSERRGYGYDRRVKSRGSSPQITAVISRRSMPRFSSGLPRNPGHRFTRSLCARRNSSLAQPITLQSLVEQINYL